MDRLPNDNDDFVENIKRQFPDDYEYRQQLEFRLTKSLVPIQSEALRIVDWLFYGARGSGRSYVFCVAALLRAIRYPDTWVDVYDHYDLYSREYKHFVVGQLDSIIGTLPNPNVFTIKHTPRLQVRFSTGEGYKG